MIEIDKQSEAIERFISESMEDFSTEIQVPRCMILNWRIDKSDISIDISTNQEIEQIARDKEIPEYPNYRNLELKEWETTHLHNDSIYKAGNDVFKWSEQPHKENLDAFVRFYLNKLISRIYNRDSGIDIFVNTDYLDDWEHNKLVYSTHQNQIGRLIVSRLRDTPMNHFHWIKNLDKSPHKEYDRFINLFKSLTAEQKKDIEEFYLDLIDLAVFDFLEGINDFENENEYEGVRLLVGNRELNWRDFLGGGYKEEYFLWRERFSKYAKNTTKWRH